MTALVMICILAIPALASDSSWDLVRAEYGSGNSWVDVTERVRSLVQGDALQFTVSGTALGMNSRRGRNRTLRLQLSDLQGRTKQISYRDNQPVRLRINNASQVGSKML